MTKRTLADRQDEKVGVLVNQLRDCYSMARHFKLTHDDVSKRVSATVWHDEDFAKLPEYRRYYLRGINDQLWHVLNMEMEWRLAYNGKYVKYDEIPNEDRRQVLGGKYFWPNSDREW